MAEKSLRLPRNVAGRFYVDETCIDCDLCRQIAPDVFAQDDEEGKSYVMRQPLTPEEREAAHEAMESCPTESIGDDGDEKEDE